MNSSSLPSTHSKLDSNHLNKRLFITTGKGGVGKTSLALALTKLLKEQGKKVLYNSFDAEPPKEYLRELDLPHVYYPVEESAETYVASKLGSEIIAKWVMKTPFFNSLFNMLPGLGHMILMGHLIKMLESDPELIIVIDSPASGHAMSMLESTHNFKEMFGEGLIVSDINRMHNFLYGENNVEVLIATIPTLMSVQESQELKEYLEGIGYKDSLLMLNTSLKKVLEDNDIPKDNLPEALRNKISNEEECADLLKEENYKTIPYLTGDMKEQVEKMVSLLKEALS